MKIVQRAPNKFWVFVGGKAFSLRVENTFKHAENEIRLIPRWRVASGLFLSALFSGAGFGLHQPLIGFPMLAVALLCLWAASR